jgi:hypothetical protein
VHLGHATVRVLDHVRAGHEVGTPQPHLAAGRQPEELRRRVLGEVVALDPKLPREGHATCAGARVLGVVGDLDVLDAPGRVIVDDDLERVEHAEAPRSGPVEDLTHGVLELAELDDAVGLGHADHRREVA